MLVAMIRPWKYFNLLCTVDREGFRIFRKELYYYSRLDFSIRRRRRETEVFLGDLKARWCTWIINLVSYNQQNRLKKSSVHNWYPWNAVDKSRNNYYHDCSKFHHLYMGVKHMWRWLNKSVQFIISSVDNWHSKIHTGYRSCSSDNSHWIHSFTSASCETYSAKAKYVIPTVETSSTVSTRNCSTSNGS